MGVQTVEHGKREKVAFNGAPRLVPRVHRGGHHLGPDRFEASDVALKVSQLLTAVRSPVAAIKEQHGAAAGQVVGQGHFTAIHTWRGQPRELLPVLQPTAFAALLEKQGLTSSSECLALGVVAWRPCPARPELTTRRRPRKMHALQATAPLLPKTSAPRSVAFALQRGARPGSFPAEKHNRVAALPLNGAPRGWRAGRLSRPRKCMLHPLVDRRLASQRVDTDDHRDTLILQGDQHTCALPATRTVPASLRSTWATRCAHERGDVRKGARC